MNNLGKEIKNLKEELKIKSLVDLEKYSKKDLISVLGKEYISKDKIREKIKEIEEKDKKYKHFMSDGREEFVMETVAIPILKELLEEKEGELNDKINKR